MASPFSSNHNLISMCILLVLTLLMSLASQNCYGFTSFGFDIHHRFSDPVKGILGIDELPEKGTREYYVAMAHRDSIFRGRRLAGDHQTPLTFADGNITYQIADFGFLHFANVSVGTPASWFLVALDTGSNLFWLPCNCTSCVKGLKTSTGQTFSLNIYDPNASTTSQNVSCNNSLCEQQSQCPSSGGTCSYEIDYLSNGTSTTGFLVEDVLQLITDDDQEKDADTRVTFGCGQNETGAFLEGGAPNGLLGLGMGNISVPSTLANQGLTSNSFSMCFGSDGYGRISFGGNSSFVQGKTPFNLRALNPTYNISVTRITVGENVSDVEFYAIFDSGTSYTSLNDPPYTQITEKFNSLIKQNRSSSSGSDLPFEYCYDISPNQKVEVPNLNLTMEGGDNYYVIEPIVTVTGEGVVLLCLGIVKSDSVNIIGQNFMTGYHIVFDRENMILGWKESNCYDNESSNLTNNRSHSPAASPALAVNPVATSNQSNDPGRQASNHSFQIKPAFAFMMTLYLVLAIF